MALRMKRVLVNILKQWISLNNDCSKNGCEKMGLFRRKSDHDKKVEKAYKCYKSDAALKLFPKGLSQADEIIRGIADICAINLEKSDAQQYFELLNIYSDTYTRYVSDSIGIPYGTDESKKLDGHFNSLALSAVKSLISKDAAFADSCIYVLHSMYLYGMVLEMHRLGMN